MNIHLRTFLSTVMFLIFIQFMSGQSIKSIRLPRDYKYDYLDKIIAEMGKDLNIRFVYDSTYLNRFRVAFEPSKDWNDKRERTVGAVFRTLSNSWDMEILISEDGFIYIARDKEQLDELQRKNNAALMLDLEDKKISRQILNPVKTNFTLTGEIYDSGSGERLPYAALMLNASGLGTTTDANGRFTLNNVPSDTCSIMIKYIGYRTKVFNLEPDLDNNPILIELEPQPQDIANVFIYGRKDDKALQQYTGEHKMKMATEALKLLPNVGEKDVLRGFQLMPGVSASNESSSGMYVRGGTPDQNLILYDGFTVYYVDHLHGFYSAFNSNAIKDVQLYKGGFESKYGGRLSSVTEITAKDGNQNKFTVGGEVSLLSMNVYTEIPIGDKITSLFAFRRSYQGYMWNKISGQSKVADSETAVAKPRKSESSSSPAYFYDLNGKITFKPNDNNIISLSIFNGADYIDNTPGFSFGGRPPSSDDDDSDVSQITMDNSDYAKYGNFGTSLRWARKINSQLSTNLLMSFSNFYATRDQSRTITVKSDGVTETTKTGTIEDNNLLDFSIKNDWKYHFNDSHTLEFGLFGTQYDIEYTYVQNSADDPLLDKRSNGLLAGGYIQNKMTLANTRMVLTPGVRVNYFTPTGKTYLEPRLCGSYQLSDRVTLNAASGIFYQYANRIMREDILSGNTDFWILSDGDDIPVSRSNHFNLGLNYDLQNYIFSVEGYYKRNYNISEYTLRYQSNRIQGPGSGNNSDNDTQVSENFYVGNGYSTGIEFLAQKKAGKFSGWISYTIAEVKKKFPDQSEKYYYASQDVTHELKAVGIYKFGNFDVSATWIFASGRPYTAPLGAYQISSATGVVDSYYAVSDKNVFRLPDYHRLDLAANFRFDIFGTKGRPNAISVSLFNAYNRRNVSAKQFEIVDNTILESNINYLSITPNVTLTFKF